jgi:3-dehydroquinate synthase
MSSCFEPVRVEIASSTGCYEIQIGEGLLEQALRDEGERLFIVDQFLAGRCAAAGIEAITLVGEERTKSLDRMAALVEEIRSRHATRSTTLIAIGGGVVQDCASFVASVYMRGVPWNFVPTTLLSMVDSCIGGKSSINVGPYKNIVGTFHPPRCLMIDPALTRTLSTEQRIAGLCEAVKICMCRGADAFEAYLSLGASPDADPQTVTAVVELSLRAKKWFIEIDEFDRKERLVLNFGHTFGHAIEAASGFAISHGVAVGLGMLAALQLGEDLGQTRMSDPRVKAFHDHVRGLLAGVDGLGDTLGRCPLEQLMDAFCSDKKHSRDHLAVIVVNPTGDVERIMLPRNDEILARISNTFSNLKAELAAMSGPGAQPAGAGQGRRPPPGPERMSTLPL